MTTILAQVFELHPEVFQVQEYEKLHGRNFDLIL